MSYSILIRREAEIDLDEIFVWYEMQKVGLDFNFVTQFEETLQKILNNHYYTATILKDARRATLKRFPYEIVYRINEQNVEVRIIAIIHQSRDPGWFRGRITQ